MTLSESAMSLATQLARGTLALPMLLGFAALGLLANERVDADPIDQAAELVEQLQPLEHDGNLGQQLAKLCGARSGRTHVLVLAQAPGDLGTLAVRFNTPCRA
jgi:hypothetical protein